MRLGTVRARMTPAAGLARRRATQLARAGLAHFAACTLPDGYEVADFTNALGSKSADCCGGIDGLVDLPINV